MLTTLRLVALNRSVMFLAIAVLAISASATLANTVHAQDRLGGDGTDGMEPKGICEFSSELDNPHRSGGEVSAHGWWIDRNDYCPQFADVENWLHQWTCDATGGNCSWILVDQDETRVREGGGRGRRNTVRGQCATDDTTGYRNIVDLDLVGRYDTADQYYRTFNVDCRVYANGSPYNG